MAFEKKEFRCRFEYGVPGKRKKYRGEFFCSLTSDANFLISHSKLAEITQVLKQGLTEIAETREEVFKGPRLF